MAGLRGVLPQAISAWKGAFPSTWDVHWMEPGRGGWCGRPAGVLLLLEEAGVKLSPPGSPGRGGSLEAGC